MAATEVRPLEPADIVLCEALLDSLPEWFALEERSTVTGTTRGPVRP